MKTGWFLQACIVVAVGMALMSCTKEEIDHVMNRPAEIMLQSSPCQPAGIASTATPEFCVNVMEIQLTNHDTQADVGLTLVNRTGRRHFIYVSGMPSMIDSSGAKWLGRRHTGLGSGTHYPVTLEPNVETQGSITFYQSGQATTDLTFSMRGEIVIMQVDSRGQPIPFKIAVTRGFNISGIRIPQPQPAQPAPTSGLQGSTSPVQQSKKQELPPSNDAIQPKADTKLAQVSPQVMTPGTPGNQQQNSPRGNVSNAPSASSSATAVSEPISIDIVGLRLGMSVAEVEKVFKQRRLDNGIVPSPYTNALGKTFKVLTFRDIATGQQVTIKDSEYVSSMRGSTVGTQSEEITVEFTPLHNKEQVVSIWRQQYYSAGDQPATDTFHKSLQDKYGSLRAKNGCDINGINCRYEWHYSQDGKPILNNSNECIGYNQSAGARMNTPGQEKYFTKCGSIEVVAKVDDRDGLVSGVRVNAYNRELDVSAHKAANAIMAAAEKERTDRQMQKARTQKPDF